MSVTDESTSSTTRQSSTTAGNFGITMRSRPYRPAFETIPDSTAETSAGDSRYVSGSHPCSGKNGDLIAKARQLAEDLGRRPATVDEARSLLGIAPREREAASA